MAVATTILQQLGGRQMMTMVGVKPLTVTTVDEKLGGLRFRFDGTKLAKGGINFVKVVLDYSDTYLLEFGRVWGKKYTVVATFDNVYCDDLQDIFESTTGMYTTLFARR